MVLMQDICLLIAGDSGMYKVPDRPNDMPEAHNKYWNRFLDDAFNYDLQINRCDTDGIVADIERAISMELYMLKFYFRHTVPEYFINSFGKKSIVIYQCQSDTELYLRAETAVFKQFKHRIYNN